MRKDHHQGWIYPLHFQRDAVAECLRKGDLRQKGEPVDVAGANAPRIVPDRSPIEPLIEEGCVKPVSLEAVEVLFGGHSDDVDGM